MVMNTKQTYKSPGAIFSLLNYNPKRISMMLVFLLVCVSCYLIPRVAEHSNDLLLPAPLTPGDTILFVSPSGPLDSARIFLAKQRLEERGYAVIHSRDILRSRGYLGGSDKRRAEELMNAFKSPGIKAIFPGTGGYGTTRILDRLDYQIIRDNPKILIGFSDITALHLAINKMTGLVTFHTPNPMYGLGSENNLSTASAHYFWKALEDNNPKGYTIELDSFELSDSIIVINKGKGTGELIGGNLSLISTLMGTKYEIDAHGKILFIEDVGEAPYRIDRFLSQLKLAGIFENVNGIILGKFTRRSDEPPDDPESFSMREVLEQYFSELDVPVIANYPVGHYKDNISLPIGVPAELDADNKIIRLLTSPTHLDKRKSL